MKPTFYRQRHENTCGIAVIRSVLENKFDIKKTEGELIDKIAEPTYVSQCMALNRKIQKEFVIREYGTDVYHFANIAKYFGLIPFSSNHGSVENIKFLMDQGIWPMIYRPFEEDKKGHYVLPFEYNHSMYLFNPANGSEYGEMKEAYPIFDEKWVFQRRKPAPGIRRNRWMLFFSDKRIEVPFKGRWL